MTTLLDFPRRSSRLQLNTVQLIKRGGGKRPDEARQPVRSGACYACSSTRCQFRQAQVARCKIRGAERHSIARYPLSQDKGFLFAYLLSLPSCA